MQERSIGLFFTFAIIIHDTLENSVKQNRLVHFSRILHTCVRTIGRRKQQKRKAHKCNCRYLGFSLVEVEDCRVKPKGLLERFGKKRHHAGILEESSSYQLTARG